MKTKHNTKDPLILQIINFLCTNNNLQQAYLLHKSTTTTKTKIHFPTNNVTPQHYRAKSTITLLTITKSPRRMSGPHQPTAHNVIANPHPVIANPNEVGVKQPRLSPSVGLPKEGTPENPQTRQPENLPDHLHNLTQKQVKITLLPFTVKAVQNHLNKGSNFLSKALTTTPCIYDNGEVSFDITDTFYHPTVYDEIRREWDTRLKRAEYLYDKASTLNATQNPVACFDLLHNVLKQTCLGLIYVFMEYKPSQTGLTLLFDLCSLFTDLPDKVFPSNSYRSQHLLHHLQNAHTLMLHKTKHNLTPHHAQKAWKKTGHFLQEAKTLALQTCQP